MRGIAATIVILYHAARHAQAATGGLVFGSVFAVGHAGVDLFFVLSGFIILHVHGRDLGHPERLRRYGGRRLTRILPTYWVALAVTMAFPIIAGRGLPPMPDLLESLTLLPVSGDPLLGIAWTLKHEMLFYGLFAILIVHRAAGIAVLGLWLAAIAVALAYPGSLPLQATIASPYNLEFFFGMAAALAVSAGLVRRPRLLLTIGLTAFLAAALAESLAIMNGHGFTARLGYGLASMLIVAGVAARDQTGIGHVPSALARLGAASFSLYIFQYVFMAPTWQILRTTGLAAHLSASLLQLVLAASAVGGGLAAAAFIERPLIRLLRGSDATRSACGRAAIVARVGSA